MLALRGFAIVAAGALALFNGLAPSPVFDSVDYMLGVATRGYPLLNRGLLYNYVSPLAIAAMTLLIGGIPAAIYERARGHASSTPVSLGIWLVATLLLALPTFMRLMRED
jgi:hypothetical protein